MSIELPSRPLPFFGGKIHIATKQRLRKAIPSDKKRKKILHSKAILWYTENTMRYEAKNYGMLPNAEIGANLSAFLKNLEKRDEKEELVFEKGTYFLDLDNCPVRHYHITNTIGEKEYLACEEKWRIPVGVLLENVKNFTLDGNGSLFVIRGGDVTNMVFDHCENVTVRNLEIRVEKPHLHRIYVEKHGLFKTTFGIDEHSDYVVEDGKLFFVGKNYRLPLTHKRNQRYFNSSYTDREKYFTRIAHPLAAAKYKIEENKIVAKGFFPKNKVRNGQDFYLYDNRRLQVGVFMQGCKNITLQNYTQRFSRSLAVVCQDCDTLTFDALDLSPEPNSTVRMCSIADFLHLCCCRGQLTVKNSYFSSSGDDVLNVHGIHFPIGKIEKNEITVSFAHPEAYGFNIFHVGDKVAIIGRKDLLEKKTAIVVDSKMIDLYTIKLILDTEIGSKFVGDAVENVSANPDILFENNTFDRISTRGILCTTRGKAIIRNNRFLFTKMWAVEVADDALDWYEGTMIKDLTIEGNEFFECCQTMIHVFPHNIFNNGYVHENVTVRNNIFHLKKGEKCYVLRCVKNVRLIGNTYLTSGKRNRLLSNVSADVREKDFKKKEKELL